MVSNTLLEKMHIDQSAMDGHKEVILLYLLQVCETVLGVIVRPSLCQQRAYGKILSNGFNSQPLCIIQRPCPAPSLFFRMRIIVHIVLWPSTCLMYSCFYSLFYSYL